jgi:hypothetical protein
MTFPVEVKLYLLKTHIKPKKMKNEGCEEWRRDTKFTDFNAFEQISKDSRLFIICIFGFSKKIISDC